MLVFCCMLLGELCGSFVSIPFHTGLIALLAAVMVWIASYDKAYTLPEGRLKRVLVYVGARSYAIYLIHVLVFRLTWETWARLDNSHTFGGTSAALFKLAAFPVILALAELNYRFVERPLRRHGARLADRWERARRTEVPVIA
jgi:peptidoglycan/LPS O-acetylase OafA/YrhL